MGSIWPCLHHGIFDAHSFLINYQICLANPDKDSLSSSYQTFGKVRAAIFVGISFHRPVETSLECQAVSLELTSHGLSSRHGVLASTCGQAMPFAFNDFWFYCYLVVSLVAGFRQSGKNITFGVDSIVLCLASSGKTPLPFTIGFHSSLARLCSQLLYSLH